ncbi:MAG: hypothetical protein IH877_08780, partial [Gemmatimonadetes bacterium]|nr:hypothetical protein [Gemmatimonadota bacterium]
MKLSDICIQRPVLASMMSAAIVLFGIRDLDERDLKLVPPEELTTEQLEVWNQAYDPKNDPFR